MAWIHCEGFLHQLAMMLLMALQLSMTGAGVTGI